MRSNGNRDDVLAAVAKAVTDVKAADRENQKADDLYARGRGVLTVLNWKSGKAI
jgi:hypothetical protein